MSDKTKKEVMARYEELVHAMQSGVAMLTNYETKSVEPIHLRIGINAALCDSAALAKLLIAKGLITEFEYLEFISTEMEAEVRRYEQRLSVHGIIVKLA